MSILSAAVAADVWHDFICDKGRNHAQTHTNRHMTEEGLALFSASNTCAPSYAASATRITAWICLLTGEHGRRKNAQILILSANVFVTNSSLFVAFKIPNGSRLCSKPDFLHVYTSFDVSHTLLSSTAYSNGNAYSIAQRLLFHS